MMRTLYFIVVVALITAGILCPTTWASASEEPKLTDITAELKIEADRLEKGHASHLFGIIINSNDPSHPAGLTPDQTNLVTRLDGITRQILRNLLLAGLDEEPRPPLVELQDRLGTTEVQRRQFIVADAESILLQAILTSDQAKLCVKFAVQSTPKLLRDRDGHAAFKAIRQPQSTLELESVLRTERENLGGGYLSKYFMFLDRRIAGGWRGLLMNQESTCKKIDLLCRDILQRWIDRCFDARGKVTEDTSAKILIRLALVRSSITAYAEAIVTHGILTKDQSEEYLRHYWRAVGVQALQDAELASLLRLTKDQRLEVDARLEILSDTSFNSTKIHLNTIGQISPQQPGSQEIIDQSSQMMQAAIDEAEWGVWDVLNESQMKTLSKLLKKSPPAGKRIQQNRPGRPG